MSFSILFNLLLQFKVQLYNFEMRLILPKRKRNYGYFKYHFSKKNIYQNIYGLKKLNIKKIFLLVKLI